MILSEESKQRFHEMLLKMRQEVHDQVRAKYQVASDRDYTGDLGDCANSDMAAEYAYMQRGRLMERLLLIDEALGAIERGEYGICEECEEPINEKRLLLMPFTRVCVHCQSELERQAKLRGSQGIGPRHYYMEE